MGNLKLWSKVKAALFSMRVVQFRDGNWAIRKGWYKYKYKDLCDNNSLWHEFSSSYISDCRTKDKAKVFDKYEAILEPDRGTVKRLW